MKTRIRVAVIGLIVVLLGGLTTLLVRSFWAQTKREAAQAALDLLPNVAQRIQDFHRVKIQDGRKVWEVSAAEAQYAEDEGEVTVREPSVRLYLKDGRAVGMTGEQGRVVLDGRELQQVDLSGGIEVELADYVARTEQASYDRASDRIASPSRVEISSQSMEVSGERMEVDVKAQRLRLYRNVTTILRPESLGAGGETR